MLAGFYTPDVEVVAVAPGTYIRVFIMPTTIVYNTATGVGGPSTSKMEVGTWNGVMFTSEQLISVVSAPNGETNQVPVLFLVPPDKAVQVTVT